MNEKVFKKGQVAIAFAQWWEQTLAVTVNLKQNQSSKSRESVSSAVLIRPLSSRPGHMLPTLSPGNAIHLLLHNILFNYPPLVLIKPLLASLPLRQHASSCLWLCIPLSVPLSLYFLFIILHHWYHWFNLTLYNWPSVPAEPTFRTIHISAFA